MKILNAGNGFFGLMGLVKMCPSITFENYKRASYFPNKSS